MANEGAYHYRGSRTGFQLLMFYGACFLLVVLYVNMYQFWAWLSRELGPGVLLKMLPIIVTMAVLLIISLYFVRRVNNWRRIKFVFFGLGIVAAFIALAIPDPKIPIKKIHVAEYILLSFFVRYILSHRLQGISLLLFTTLVTALYGVHDEMLQGFHSLRYYGWRDIIVNSVGGISGAFLGHGLICFERDEKSESTPRGFLSVTSGQAVLFTFLMVAVVWQVIYLYNHRENAVSLLSTLPVSVSCVMIAMMNRELVFNANEHHGLQAVYWLALGLVVYPALAGANWIEFR